MQIGTSTAAPLLRELARAVHAREFYPADHPSIREALRHATREWLEALRELGTELSFEVRADGLVLPDGSVLDGPGIDDVHRELFRRRAPRLRFHPELESGEFGSLAVLLAADRSEPEPVSLEAALLRAGVRHITTSDDPFEEHTPLEEPDDTVIELVNVEQGGIQLERSGSGPTESESLLRVLDELEACEDTEGYRRLCNRIDELVNLLLHAKQPVEAYRAAEILRRHSQDPARRNPAIRIEAQECLRSIFDDDGFLQFLLERAYGRDGIGSVQAVQILNGLGAPIVSRLIDEYMQASPDDRSRLASVIITMGDAAFPGIVDELAEGAPSRARRAARLLGDMQHPRAVEFLGRQRLHADPVVRREVMKALARIGNERAVELLVDALDRGDELAELAAACLGSCRGDHALAVLSTIAEAPAPQPSGVRREAIRSLGRLGRSEALGVLIPLLESKSWFGGRRQGQLRTLAAQAIGRIGGTTAGNALRRHLDERDESGRRACEEALRALESPPRPLP